MTGKQLFLDDEMIDSTCGVVRTLHRPVKHPANPVVVPHEPWMKMALVFGSVIREQDLWRMWYFASTDLGHGQGADPHAGLAACYAESDDGITWRYPALDVYAHDGAPTNVVLHRDLSPGFAELYAVLRRHDGAGYVAMANLLWTKEDSPLNGTVSGQEGMRRPGWYRNATHGGIVIATSDDGIHWRVPTSYTIDYPTDISHLMYDESIEKYVIYGRLVTDTWHRKVQRLESRDLVDWEPSETREVFATDELDPDGVEIYSMMVMGCGAQYVGFAQMYDKPGGLVDIQLTTSRDGLRWSRVADRQVWLPLGGPGEWDRFNASMASAPVRVGDELWFYYGGRTYRHAGHRYAGKDNGPQGSGIGIAAIRVDGFVSLDATFEGGRITTREVVLGDQLHLNAACFAGAITVELVGDDDTPVATSDPLSTDSIDAVVTWGGQPSIPAVVPPGTRLRFSLVNARFYSYWSE